MSAVTETLQAHTAPLATKVTKEHRLVTLQTASVVAGLAFVAGLAVGAGPTPEAPAAQGVAAAGEASPAAAEVVTGTPAVAAPAPHKPTQLTGNCPQWRDLVAKHFPPDQVNNALNVMKGESGCRANAVGDTAPEYISWRGDEKRGYSVGLMQIRLIGNRPNELYLRDPENNVKYAAGMFKAQGWCPWSAAHKIGLAKPCK